MPDLSPAELVAYAGLAIGVLAGILMHQTKFCTWGGIYDAMAGEGGSRLRSWLLAMAVAIVGVQTLVYLGILDLSAAIQLNPRFGWGTTILGGLIFGIGMALARGCGARNLVRLGTGDLKAFVVVLVFGITAYMTLRGLLFHVPDFINQFATFNFKTLGLKSSSAGEVLSALTPINAYIQGIDANLVLAGVVVLLLLLLTFLSSSFRSSGRHIFAGIGVGLLVVAGWYAVGVWGFDSFEEKHVFPLLSLNFVSPAGDALQYYMTFGASALSFGIASVLGVPVGSFVSSLISRDFQLAGFDDAQDLARSLLGAVMMGLGAVAAFGCTIGQGVSGLATLAVGSIVALIAIMIGGVIGYKIRFRS